MPGAEAQGDLVALIARQIRANGPISVATYMGLALTHPRHGYYRKADPLGEGGDFVTAPEISQMFGELIGFFFVNLWQQMREPAPFTLLELGPGRGTLVADMLRVAARAPGFLDALQLQLFETNPTLMAAQKARLSGQNAKWLADFDDLGEGPLLILANEFFDALPIRQFVRGPQGWHERQVGLADGRLVFGLSPLAIPNESMPPEIRGAAEGEVYEANLAAVTLMSRLVRPVAERGGAILIIDYGYPATRTGETLQAVRRHAYADPLESPGEADISAHVDFGALAATARKGGLAVQPLVEQGEFLRRLGIVERAAALSKANPGHADSIGAALERLTGPRAMGALFKVFAATSPGLVPPGFAP